MIAIVPIEGFVNPLSGLYSIDFDSDGVYELLSYQRISGRFATDALGYVQTILKWNNRKFDLFDQYVAITGKNCPSGFLKSLKLYRRKYIYNLI